MHHIYWLLELGLHPHTCHTYLPITQPFVTLNAHPVVEMPQFGRCGPLKHLKPWRRFGGSSLPAQIDCSFRPGNFCSGYRWLNQRRIELGEGGMVMAPNHVISLDLERPVDICWPLEKKLHLNISQRFWSRSCLGACGDNFCTGVLWHFRIFGWLKTHVLPSGKLTVGPWKYPFFNGN